jgi:hypothetical protein
MNCLLVRNRMQILRAERGPPQGRNQRSTPGRSSTADQQKYLGWTEWSSATRKILLSETTLPNHSTCSRSTNAFEDHNTSTPQKGTPPILKVRSAQVFPQLAQALQEASDQPRADTILRTQGPNTTSRANYG